MWSVAFSKMPFSPGALGTGPGSRQIGFFHFGTGGRSPGTAFVLEELRLFGTGCLRSELLPLRVLDLLKKLRPIGLCGLRFQSI